MSYSATVYKVMIASPSDVPAERSLIREVLAEWNVVNADHRRQVVLPVGWETHSVPEMGDRPQSIINKQVLRGCDLLVGVFWTRIGTATGQYESGTVEEIEEHIKLGGSAMLYFSAAPVVLDSVDPDQYQRLKAFRSSCQARGLYEPYTDVQDFRSKFYRQLQLKMNHDPRFATQAPSNTQVVESSQSTMPSLTREAAFLLKEAASDPSGQVVFISYLSGDVLQVKGKNLIEEGNNRSRALWEGALEELEREALLAALSPERNLFKLTRRGYEVADQLA